MTAAPRSLADTAKALLAKIDGSGHVAPSLASWDVLAVRPLLLAVIASSELPERWRADAKEVARSVRAGTALDCCAADLERALAVAEEQGT